MKSKEELEKEPMPYDNETPKKCPKCGNWFLNYPALSRRDNKTYICPDCGVKEAMEDYMSSRKKEGLEEATAKALLEDPENESLTKPLTESVDWSYYNKFEDLINKYMPDEGEGETLASQIVTAVNKLIYKWYNDGDVFDNVNSGLNGWANDLSDYANWLYKYAPGDAPSILKNIYGMGDESDYETLLKELADNLLDENLLSSLEKAKQGSIYDCDGPFEFSIYDEDEDEWDDYEEDEDEEDLEESKKLQEGVNNLIIKTGLTDKNAYDVLRSVEGQLADGIWENSPGMSRFWQYMSIDYEGSEVVAKFDTNDYSSGFRGKDELQIKKWLANKVKQIVKEEGLDWDRNNTETVSYMHGNVTVQDAYRVYDKLLGRKDYIPDPNKKEESKEIDDIESEYRQAIDRAFDIMKLYGKDNKYYRKAVKKEKDLQKQLHDLKALKNESKEVMKKEINKDELLNKLEDYVLNQYTIFNDKLYDDFGDIQLNDKDNTKRSIYIYYDIEEDKISVTVGAAGARTFVDTLDEVAQFINAEIAKVNAQDEELKESKEVKTEGTKQKRIARYNEFDNGYVFHSWKEMSDEEAEEKAKQASIEDPTDVYYVAYDDIMNPSSEIRWYKGKSYSCEEITELRRKEKEALLNKTESKEDLDKEHDEYLKKMDKKYKTFCKNLEITDDPDDALSALDELEGQFGDEDGEYQELREFIYNELLESKKIEEDDKELEESKNGKYTDEDIRKAIRADIKEHNGLFTDDSKYDVIERLTGIADIDEQPEGLWERVDKIYETEFEKVNKKEENKLVEADDENVEDIIKNSNNIDADMTKYFKDRFEKYLKEVEDADIRGLEAYYDIQPSRISIGYSGERFDGHNDEDKKKMIKILNNTAQFESLIGDILKLAYKNSNIRYEYQGNHSNPYFGKEFTMYNLPFNLSETSNSYQNKNPHELKPETDYEVVKKNNNDDKMIKIRNDLLSILKDYIEKFKQIKGIWGRYNIYSTSFTMDYGALNYTYDKYTAKQALNTYNEYKRKIQNILQELSEEYSNIDIIDGRVQVSGAKIGKQLYVSNLPFEFDESDQLLVDSDD